MTGEAHTEWTDRFSEYLADDLEPEERTRISEHLARCAACRDVLAELQQVLAVAREADDLHPPRDLWPEVAAAIESTGRSQGRDEAEDVIVLPTASGRPVGPGWSNLRLAAAAVALVAVSVSATWWVASATVAEAGSDSVRLGAGGDVAAVAGGADLPSDLADRLRTLEGMLEVARPALDSSTVRALERNLSAIETAIADSRDALASDPGNAFLMEHLERMYRRKLIYLQDAVRVAEWES